MPLCSHSSTCGCLVLAGDGMTVSGSGIPTDPWVVTNASVESGSYTPTLYNIDIDDGSNVGYYAWVGYEDSTDVGMIMCHGVITLGTSGSVTGSVPGFYLPSGFEMAVETSNLNARIGIAGYDCNGTSYIGSLTPTTDADRCRMYAQNSAGTYVTRAACSSTVPDTWADGDVITWSIYCRARRT